MDQVNVDIPGLDWIDIRQSLSLSLLQQRPVRISRACRFLEENPVYIPLYRDMEVFFAASGAGSPSCEAGDLLFTPGSLQQWRADIDTGKFSSAVDMVLLLMPMLFYRESRTVLLCRGVTHSPWSFPTSFMKETFLAILEATGHYGSVLLQRFGFYGTGGGSLEAKIYPAEPRRASSLIREGEGTITGVRIFMAGINIELAKREKVLLCEELGLEENQASIIDIRDAAGFGNSVQVTVEQGTLPVIITGEMRLYNHAGDFIFDEEEFNLTLRELVKESRAFAGNGRFPETLAREICPYLLLSGTDIPDYLMGGRVSSTMALCREFINHRRDQGDR